MPAEALPARIDEAYVRLIHVGHDERGGPAAAAVVVVEKVWIVWVVVGMVEVVMVTMVRVVWWW